MSKIKLHFFKPEKLNKLNLVFNFKFENKLNINPKNICIIKNLIKTFIWIYNMKKNKSENIHKYEWIFITKSFKNFRSSCKICKIKVLVFDFKWNKYRKIKYANFK